MARLNIETCRNNFSKSAWASACLSLLLGLSHVRSFPSYNFALSLVALYASAQDEPNALMRSITACAIMGTLSFAADITFCSLWAREIIDGYSGVLRFCLVLFVLNMFAKAAMLYSAMTVSVAASEDSTKSDDDSEREPSPIHRSKSLDTTSQEEGLSTPAHGCSFRSEAGDHGINLPSPPPPETPGISGLVSPGYDLRPAFPS